MTKEREFFKTNCSNLQPELLDIVRLFSEFDLQIEDIMEENGNRILATITVNGRQFLQSIEIKAEGEIERKRQIKRFA